MSKASNKAKNYEENNHDISMAIVVMRSVGEQREYLDPSVYKYNATRDSYEKTFIGAYPQ